MDNKWQDDDFFQSLAKDGLESGGDNFERYGKAREYRLKVTLRGLVLLVVIGFAVYFVKMSIPDLKYFFNRNEPVVDLGDLRSPDLDKGRLTSLEANREVRFKNDVITVDKIRSDDKEYYFSPVTNCIVRTPQVLPDKSPWEVMVVELDGWESEMVAGKKAFPADLRVSIDGDGRYFPAKDRPEWLAPLVRLFSEQTKVPENEICVFFDRELPSSMWVSLVVVASAMAVVLVTLLVFLVALRKYLNYLKGD